MPSCPCHRYKEPQRAWRPQAVRRASLFFEPLCRGACYTKTARRVFPAKDAGSVFGDVKLGEYGFGEWVITQYVPFTRTIFERGNAVFVARGPIGFPKSRLREHSAHMLRI